MSLRPGYSWSATTCGTRDVSGIPALPSRGAGCRPMSARPRGAAGAPWPRQPPGLPPRRHPHSPLAHRLPGGRRANPLPPRLSPHRRPQPHPRQRPRAGRHAPDRPQEPGHLRPVQHHPRAGTPRGRRPAGRLSGAAAAGSTNPSAAPRGWHSPALRPAPSPRATPSPGTGSQPRAGRGSTGRGGPGQHAVRIAGRRPTTAGRGDQLHVSSIRVSHTMSPRREARLPGRGPGTSSGLCRARNVPMSAVNGPGRLVRTVQETACERRKGARGRHGATMRLFS